MILYILDPESSALNRFLFYTDFAILSYMVACLAGFYLRQRWGQREFRTKHFAVSARQAVWFMILLTASLYLLSHDLFSLVNSILLVLALIFLESFFIARQKNIE